MLKEEGRIEASRLQLGDVGDVRYKPHAWRVLVIRLHHDFYAAFSRAMESIHAVQLRLSPSESRSPRIARTRTFKSPERH